MIRFYCLLFLLLQLAGCGSTYPIRVIEPATGLYPASAEFPQKDVDVFTPLKEINEVKFVYLRAHSPLDDGEFESLHRAALADLGFDNVINEEQFAQVIIEAGLIEQVPSVSDLISMNKASQVLGDFLVVEVSQYAIAGSRYEQVFSVLFPRRGKTYLKMKRDRVVWLSHSDEVVYPALNVFKSWLDESRRLAGPLESGKQPPDKGI